MLRTINEQLRQEIAERNRAQEALRQSEEKLRRLLQSMAEGGVPALTNKLIQQRAVHNILDVE